MSSGKATEPYDTYATGFPQNTTVIATCYINIAMKICKNKSNSLHTKYTPYVTLTGGLLGGYH